MYDQVTKADDKVEGSNYCMLEESTFSGTYESISADRDMYSEVKSTQKSVVQVNSVCCGS